MPSICAIGFFKWTRCFSNMWSRPSFVNGLGSTSFIPSNVNKAAYHQDVDVPCWKYIEMSSLRMLEVIATMGVVSNCRIKWQAETPSRLGMIISISTKSYFEPAFILLTASRPSSC
jgi:hypothetical protein